jgi:hypothetical protein
MAGFRSQVFIDATVGMGMPLCPGAREQPRHRGGTRPRHLDARDSKIGPFLPTDRPQAPSGNQESSTIALERSPSTESMLLSSFGRDGAAVTRGLSRASAQHRDLSHEACPLPHVTEAEPPTRAQAGQQTEGEGVDDAVRR